MDSFFRPQHHKSRSSCHIAATVASRLLRRQQCRSISWRRQQQQHTALPQQCRQLQQDLSAARTRHHLGEDDSRLMQNAVILERSIWRDFFRGYSNPENSSQQQAWIDRADELKEQVAQIMVASSTTSDLHGRLHLIDVLEHLCLDHLFEEDINAAWDLKAAHDLPECIRFALRKVLDSYEIIENMLQKEEKYRMLYLRYFIEDLVRGFNMEVKMLQEGYIPNSVEEHLKVSLRTGGCPFLSCASFVGINDVITKDCFDWVASVPKMVQALSIILRLLNDLQSSEREQLIGHVALTIDSYMKEHNVSIEEAREKIQILKENTWKDFNSKWLDPNTNAYPKQLLERIFNLTRTMEFMYNQEDNFTNCSNLKDTIQSLLAEPFKILI
nr:unnamed protein product [Digitaria exilis]